MPETLKPDLCIIGAGASAASIALRARAKGASVVWTDVGLDDGEGSRVRHLALLAAAARVHAIRTAKALGIEGAETPKTTFRTVPEQGLEVEKQLAPAEAAERLRALGVTVLQGAAAFADRATLIVGDISIKAGHFILATGSRTGILQLPGLNEIPYLTPDTVLDNTRKLTHLVVIGGDATAVELAQAYRRLGAEVSLVPQGDVLPGFDRETVDILLRALAEEGVAIYPGASVTAVLPRPQGTGITFTLADGNAETLDVSHVLVAACSQPRFSPELLAKAGVKPDPGREGQLLASAAGRTSNGRISVTGGAAGVHDRAHAARHAEIVLDAALGRPMRVDTANVVRHVESEPALAQFGELDAGASPRAGRVVLRGNPAEHESARILGMAAAGSLKVVISRGGLVLGASMVGHGALETLALLAMARQQGTPFAQLAGLGLPASSPAAPLLALARAQEGERRQSLLGRQRAALRRLRP